MDGISPGFDFGWDFSGFRHEERDFTVFLTLNGILSGFHSGDGIFRIFDIMNGILCGF